MSSFLKPTASAGQVDKIDVAGDARISHETANLNGRTYHYLLGVPKGEQKGTIFLVHGWPDLSMGWRYQIPMFLEMGLRVVAPDLMGFGGTDGPDKLEDYGFKRVAFDLKELGRQLGVSRIFLGGHDWGGAVVHRTCNHCPEFVSHVFSVCTPYIAPQRDQPYVSLEERVATVTPNFGYQIHLASGDVEKRVHTKPDLKRFLNGAYGGVTPEGKSMFDIAKGVVFENLEATGQSPLMSEKEVDYYVEQYAKKGLGPTLNWYRMGPINWETDKEIENPNIEVPSLFILAERDAALPEWMSAKMENYMPQFTRRAVNTSHWALWERPDQVNQIIRDWLSPFVEQEHAKSKI